MAQIMAPYAQWDIPVIGQSYLLFRAKLAAPHSFSPGTESLETELFEPRDIPFDKVQLLRRLPTKQGDSLVGVSPSGRLRLTVCKVTWCAAGYQQHCTLPGSHLDACLKSKVFRCRPCNSRHS